MRLPASVSQNELEDVIAGLNAERDVDGILLQLPLPRGLDADACISRISPEKDVDGLTPHNQGLLALGRPGLQPVLRPASCVYWIVTAFPPAEKKPWL